MQLSLLRHIPSLILITLLSISVALSHPLSVSYSKFTIDDQFLTAIYRLPIDDMDLLLRLDKDLDESVSIEELMDAREQISNYLIEKSEVKLNQKLVNEELLSTTIWLDSNEFPYLESVVKYDARSEIDFVNISLGFLSDLYPEHRTLAELDAPNGQFQSVFQHGNMLSWERDGTSVFASFIEFVLFGLEHISKGFDHLLFLLGLLIVGRGLKNLIVIVTAFTIAHSITLALATLDLIQVVSWVVEAAIALSIIYVGIENLLVKEIRRRWIVAFIFGLVHGLGFAGILQELDLRSAGLFLSLISFNIGVEIGQILVIVVTWPLLNWLVKSRYRKHIVDVTSLAIATFGLVWFIERVI